MASNSPVRSFLHQFCLAVASLFLLCFCAVERGTVGARFGRDGDGHMYVREVPNDLGAAHAGMRPGDEVILIDGRDVRPLSDDDIHVILAGERGTPARFTVLRGQKVLRLTVERTPAPVASANRVDRQR